ncbi:MAG: glycoside hydrolase family 43 protein [bacterium]
MIKNPILPGFNPDPCICRRGDDFYLAVSSFEWFPGIPIYHSRDLKHWELYAHALTDESQADLKKLPASKGIWAPCLTWCEAEGLFYVVYGVMNSMNARYFDIDNFLITAPDLRGPWSRPVYLHSAGFDASILHDDDGRKYVVSLEWETRQDYEKPGAICVVEYDAATRKIVGYPRRVWRGGTDRGCIEAPHLTKHNGYYYLMCAEGGTGYYHSVTMARAKSAWGPYEGDPKNPILTSQPAVANERTDTDHLKPRYYNPAVALQKAGHGSYVDLPNGETWLAYHVSRPFLPELRCTLGRETAIQKMRWTEDGWLRTADGINLARAEVEEPALPSHLVPQLPALDDFDGDQLGMFYYAPRILPREFADIHARPGWVRLRGQESPTSLNRVSLLARKLTSVHARVTTKMDFHSEVTQQDAGLMLYYDNMDYLYLRKYYSESLGCNALNVQRMENGVRTEYARTALRDGELYFRLYIKGKRCWLEWSYDGKNYQQIGPEFDTTKFSDEYCKYGEFTGTMVGIACVDRMTHSHCADFDFLEYRVDEETAVV